MNLKKQLLIANKILLPGLAYIRMLGLAILPTRSLIYQSRAHPFDRIKNAMKSIYGGQPLVVVEVGANRGGVAKYILENLTIKNFYGLEPIPNLYRALIEKFKNYPNAKFFNIGLGDGEGVGHLYVTKHDGFSSEYMPLKQEINISGQTVSSNPFDVIEQIKFTKTTGKLFAEQNSLQFINLLSLNTQGSELKILSGFDDLLISGMVGCIAIEVDMSNRYEQSFGLTDVQVFMESKGYTLYEITNIKNIYPSGFNRLDLLYVHSKIAV